MVVVSSVVEEGSKEGGKGLYKPSSRVIFYEPICVRRAQTG